AAARTFLADIAVDPRNRDVAYVVRSAFGGGKVFVTGNAGQTWTDITGNLPDVPVNKVVIDPRSGYVYLGTDTGVYVSTNGGGTWARFGAGLPIVRVTDMTLNESLNTLAIATGGRSAYQIALDDTQSFGGAITSLSGTNTWAGPVVLA